LNAINTDGPYSEIDQDGHGHKFFLFIILGDWKGIQSLWKFSEWQRLTSYGALKVLVIENYLSKREFEDIRVILFLQVLLLPRGQGAVPDGGFLREAHIVELPFTSDGRNV